MGVFPSGQWGQTVNLLLFSFGGSNPPAPTKNSSVVMTLEFLLYVDLSECVLFGAHPVFVLPYFPLFRSSFFVAHRL